METEAPEPGPHRPRRRPRARTAVGIIVALVAVVAAGLDVRSTPTLSLRLPPGWHVVAGQAVVPSNWLLGRLSLAGPGGATFAVSWSPTGVSYGCDDTCAPVGLTPLESRFDGQPVTLAPWGPGSSHGSLVAGSLEHDVAGRPMYFDIDCRPASAAAESVCGDIVSSIGWSPPLFAGLRSDVAVVAIG